LLINGSEGIGTGFAQKILPRNKEEIKSFIRSYLLNPSKSQKPLKPFYRGFNGTIQQNESEGSWEILGSFEKLNSTTIRITEIPIGYTLSSYLKVLDSLEDRKIIKSYEDYSEDDNFLFEVKVTKEFLQQSDEDIQNSLKLVKRVSENYTCVDENNSIREFSSIEEILKAYIEVRLEYYQKRKKYLLSKYQEEIDILDSKAIFIKAVIDGDIVVSNTPKKDIIHMIESLPRRPLKLQDSFDYLLNMQIYSLTKERYDDLLNQIETKKNNIQKLSSKTEKNLWEEDLKTFEK